MSALTVLVVEDEPLAREMICSLLEQAEGVALAGACKNAAEAQERLNASLPDILLLDVEMPGLSGMELLESLPQVQRPAVVFVTAHEEYALQAFDLSAVDYVLKPFSDTRFLEAIERARRRVLEKRVSEIAVQLSEGAEGADRSIAGATATATGNTAAPTPSDEPQAYLARLVIPKAGRKLLVPVDEVRWIESDDYCVRVHTESGSHLLRASLNELEKQLDPMHFVRVHRGAIVRVDAVQTIRRREHGSRQIRLRSGEQVRVARSRFKLVEQRLMPRLTPSS